jgi:putative transposase
MARRSKDWQDCRRKRKPDDTEALDRIYTVIGDLPTYVYRRVWALLRRQSKTDDMTVINAKRVYRIMRQNALLLERKPAIPPSKRVHAGKVTVGESNQRWCSDGFEFNCDNGEKLRVKFALDCCDCEALYWAASTGGYDSETVQDVMLGAVERRFGSSLPASPVEWLTDSLKHPPAILLNSLPVRKFSVSQLRYHAGQNNHQHNRPGHQLKPHHIRSVPETVKNEQYRKIADNHTDHRKNKR